MNRPFKILLSAAALAAVFYAGMKYQSFVYEDMCLDLGGGRNPGNYPVCVVDEAVMKARNAQPL